MMWIIIALMVLLAVGCAGQAFFLFNKSVDKEIKKKVLWTFFFNVNALTSLIIGFLACWLMNFVCHVNYGVYTPLVFMMIFAVITIMTVIKGWKQVPDMDEWILQLFGEYLTTLGPGLHIIMPWFDWMSIRSEVYMGEQVMEFSLDDSEPQKPGGGHIDFKNMSAPVSAIVRFKIIDSHKAAVMVGDVISALDAELDSVIRTYLAQVSIDDALELKARFDLHRIFNGLKPEKKDDGTIDFTGESGSISNETFTHEQWLSVIDKSSLTQEEQSIMDNIPSLWLDLRNNWGIDIISVSVTDVILSDAQQKIREQVLVAEKEKQAASYQKEARIIKAQGEAEATREEAGGEADALELVGGAIAGQVSQLINQQMVPHEAAAYLTQRLKWDNVGDKTVIIDSGSFGVAGTGAVLAASMQATNQATQIPQGD